MDSMTGEEPTTESAVLVAACGVVDWRRAKKRGLTDSMLQIQINYRYTANTPRHNV